MSEKKIIINGPCKLKGKVKIQGSKNASMKHILLPLLTEGTFIFKNIPDIGSIHNLLRLEEFVGLEYRWSDKNTVKINSQNINAQKTLPQDLFFYTSSAISFIPILTSRFGKCLVEKNTVDDSYGGCKIGSRTFATYTDTLKEFGIGNVDKGNYYEFYILSSDPFTYKVPVSSFSATVNAIYSALFKKGESRIIDYTREPIFEQVLEAIIQTGADIIIKKDELIVKGMKELHGIEYEVFSDRHDFATWVSAALVTNSDILIENVDYKKMKLEQMEEVRKDLNIDFIFEKNSCKMKSQLDKLKPVNIEAGRYPDFQTEWQVLFAPLLTQIKGASSAIELLYPNRMAHWKELKKMGAKFKLSRTEKTPLFGTKNRKEQNTPNRVELTGPQKLKGAKVEANDVRAGAALIIAGLVAEGKTEITGVDQIERGYEDIVERLQSVGADIRILN